MYGKQRSWRAATAGVVLATAIVVPGSANGATTAQTATSSQTAMTVKNATTAACTMSLGAIRADGRVSDQLVTATTPPTASAPKVGPQVFDKSLVLRSAGSMTVEPISPGGGETREAWQTQGNDILHTWYKVDAKGNLVDSGVTTDLVHGDFRYFETSRYREGVSPLYARTNQYALRADGMLMRWAMDEHNWRLTQTGAAPGYASFRTMALISQTRTYDTFLGSTRGGALYTVRIPLGSPMKPVVTLVRASGWQNFETLVAERCGSAGTLLLAVDKETKSGSVYAVGHASGSTTVMQYLGKISNPGDEANFRLTARPWMTQPLAGE
ncbi:hypothetical protein AB0P21_08465 [Kribbella sp. NPDC056861]|uniref:hypothetical protein n=1 Tax=Kribbella sp. NPDC056861 TaxID=3154857 RepID=UPI00341F9250